MTKYRSDSSQLEIVGNTGRLLCGGPSVAEGLGCGTASDFRPITSPAAPALSIAEQLEKLGWTNDAGSFGSMALGLSVLCPMCSGSARTVARERKKMPNKEQLRALLDFAAQHGRGWKAKLDEVWMKASGGPLLQQVRNEFGPSWLAAVKLKDLQAAWEATCGSS